jgi:hypothetical protein
MCGQLFLFDLRMAARRFFFSPGRDLVPAGHILSASSSFMLPDAGAATTSSFNNAAAMSGLNSKPAPIMEVKFVTTQPTEVLCKCRAGAPNVFCS